MTKNRFGRRKIKIAPEEEEFIAFVAEHFDSKKYLEVHTDVAIAGVDPLRHWLIRGLKEGRRISPYLDVRCGENARSSPDQTWRSFRWRGETIAVRVIPHQAGIAAKAVQRPRRMGSPDFDQNGNTPRRGGWSLATSGLPTITQIGNPFEAIGRSEHIRTIWRALRAASVSASIYDVFGHVPEAAVFAEMGPYQVNEIADGIRIFHLNGNEIQLALDKIEERQRGFFQRGYNIVAPAWELPRYPAVWGQEIDRFDEIWAPTAFVADALRPAVSIPIFCLRNACEPQVSTLLEKSCFGIPEDSFAILNFFDVRSYASRKNPKSAIEAFRRLIAARPASKAHLVVKLNYSEFEPQIVDEITEQVSRFKDRTTVIDAKLTNNEIKNLVRCCDCFISLHRSEGFGRGPAEAMFFGKPVVATGWSGNMEYMNDQVAFPVRYTLRPVNEGEYLHFEDQVWAEPDVSHAAEVLVRIIDDPSLGHSIGQLAREYMHREFSDVVLGASYRKRIEAIAEARKSFFGDN